MNYARIYADLISDRRTNPPTVDECIERHHILPRALGGGDDTGNIVRLTPEDHYFAHLLLAKIYGGSMWAVIALMSGGVGSNRLARARISHGWATRAMRASMSGSNARQFDKTIYDLVDSNGNRWSGLQSEMPAAIGVSRSMANLLIKGSVSVASGWSIVGRVRKTTAGCNHPMYDPKTYTFVHVDGRTFTGTKLEFNVHSNLSRSAISRLTKGEAAVWNGWHLKGAELPKIGRGSKWSKV